MAIRTRRVLVFRSQLKTLDISQPGTAIEQDADVKAVMEHIRGLPWDRSGPENVYMVRESMAYALRVDEINEEKRLVKGQFASIDKDVLPEYELNGVVNSVELPMDAGIYYPFHFIHFLDRKHLAIEYNRSAPRLPIMQAYLEEKLRDSGLLDTAFCYQTFRDDPFETIDKMGSIAEVAIEVEKSKVEAFMSSPYEDVLNNLSRISPERAVIKFGISREKGAHSGAAIEKSSFLNWARERSNANNEGIKVKARVEEEADDSGSSIWLDVFAQKYASKINVKINNNKTVNSQNCYEQIERIYRRLMTP